MATGCLVEKGLGVDERRRSPDETAHGFVRFQRFPAQFKMTKDGPWRIFLAVDGMGNVRVSL